MLHPNIISFKVNNCWLNSVKVWTSWTNSKILMSVESSPLKEKCQDSPVGSETCTIHRKQGESKE